MLGRAAFFVVGTLLLAEIVLRDRCQIRDVVRELHQSSWGVHRNWNPDIVVGKIRNERWPIGVQDFGFNCWQRVQHVCPVPVADKAQCLLDASILQRDKTLQVFHGNDTVLDRQHGDRRCWSLDLVIH